MEITAIVVLTVLWTTIGIMFLSPYPNVHLYLVLWNILLLLFVVAFLEITPKALFTSHAEQFTMALAPVAYALVKIIYPFIAILEYTARGIIWIFTRKWIRESVAVVTEEELMTMVEVGQSEGVIEEQKREIIHSIFEFGDLVAREVMVPRIDIVALDIEDNIPTALDAIIKSGHSRIPVYEGSQDHIKGILFAKDLLRNIESEDLISTSVRKIIRHDILFVPETKDLSNLLEEMQAKKAHMAIVLDEYGGTAGLISIEDILEEIVGEIQDEYDAPLDIPMIKAPDGTFIIDGKLGLHELEDEIEISLPTFDGIETVGGLLLHRLGRVPDVGEIVEIPVIQPADEDEYGSDKTKKIRVIFKILDIDENRIGKVHVAFQEEEKEDSDDNGVKRSKSADGRREEVYE